MKNQWDESKEFLVTFSDAKRILSKAKNKILWTSLVFSGLGIGYSLTKPVSYEINATFREKSNASQSSNSAFSINALMSGGAENDAKQEAISILKSRSLTADLIRSLNLHAVLTPKPIKHNIFDTILANIRNEYGRFRRYVRPNIADNIPAIIAKDVHYENEIPLGMTLTLLSDDEYELKEDGHSIGKGRFNIPFKGDNFSLTLVKNTPTQPSNSYYLTLLSVNALADSLADKIDITPELKNKSVIKITYMAPDRHQGATIVNALMKIYQQFLRDEQSKQTTEQIAYLKRRQKEEEDYLRGIMHDYSNERYNDISSTGFYDPKSTIEFISLSQREHVRKSQDIDFEIKRLKSAQEKGCVYYDQYSTRGDSHVINDLLSEIRALKKESNEIDFTLRNASLHSKTNKESTFASQLAEMEETREVTGYLKEMALALQDNRIPEPPEKLLKDPKYMLEGWFLKLKEYKNVWDALPPQEKERKTAEWNGRKSQFLAYLSNLVHFYQAQEKTLQEQMAHQGSSHNEFQGISLKLSRDLYLGYCSELDQIQSSMMNNLYVIENLQDPEFEVSSLKSIVQDSISQNIIVVYSNQLMQLKDQAHRSPREQDRIREELLLQRTFLEMHLAQTNQVLNLRSKLVKDKIFNLQNITLSLIHQRISILDKQLEEYITTRISSLEDEKKVIAHQQKELNSNLSEWPQKWIDETMVDQQLKSSMSMSQEIARLVETKNISTNLDAILSGPIDHAIPPVFPRSPKLILFAILGGLAGAFFSTSYFLAKESFRGISASRDNLRALGINVSGTLSNRYGKDRSSPLLDEDLNTMRHVLTFFCQQEVKDNKILLALNNGANYSKDLARLASKKGLSVILVPASLLETTEGTTKGKKGLLQYLEGEIDTPEIFHEADYDYIVQGGFTRYSNEHIATQKYRSLMEELKETYDLVIAVSDASPNSAEVTYLQTIFSNIAITLNDDLLETLKPLIIKAKQDPNFYLTFIFTSSSEEYSLS